MLKNQILIIFIFQLVSALAYGVKSEVQLKNMKIFFVNTKIASLNNQVTDMYHFAMFHGKARRIGAEYPLYCYNLGDKLEHPLKLTKNIYSVSDIFSPNTSWIVTQQVHSVLNQYENIAFLKTEYHKVFNIKWKTGEFVESDLFDSDEILAQFSHDPSLLKTAPVFYEVITPIWDKLPQKMKTGICLTAKTGEYGVPVEITVSPQTFKTYPILWHDGHFVSEDVLERIKPYINNNFFEVIECKQTQQKNARERKKPHPVI